MAHARHARLPPFRSDAGRRGHLGARPDDGPPGPLPRLAAVHPGGPAAQVQRDDPDRPHRRRDPCVPELVDARPVGGRARRDRRRQGVPVPGALAPPLLPDGLLVPRRAPPPLDRAERVPEHPAGRGDASPRLLRPAAALPRDGGDPGRVGQRRAAGGRLLLRQHDLPAAGGARARQLHLHDRRRQVVRAVADVQPVRDRRGAPVPEPRLEPARRLLGPADGVLEVSPVDRAAVRAVAALPRRALAQRITARAVPQGSVRGPRPAALGDRRAAG